MSRVVFNNMEGPVKSHNDDLFAGVFSIQGKADAGMNFRSKKCIAAAGLTAASGLASSRSILGFDHTAAGALSAQSRIDDGCGAAYTRLHA
jgi:hypothetical protein